MTGECSNEVPAAEAIVSIEKSGGGITILRLQRPERRNALNLRVKQSLLDALAAIKDDSETRCVIITGGDKFFVGGSDISEMRDMTAQTHRKLESGKVFEQLRAFDKPTIAAVEGYALGGGCELALACDLIVASRSAQFGQPEIRVGIMPGAGGIQRLVRAAGRHRAARLLLTGEPFPAAEAFAMGLVSELVDPGETLLAATRLAQSINAMPPLAVSAILQAIGYGEDVPLTAALAYDRRLFEDLFDTADQVEGMQAFLDKRPAQFKGQ